MFFRSQLDPLKVFTNPGSGTRIIYGATIDKNGDVIVKEKGKEDLHGFIQSFKDSVDINVLVKRFLAGDVEAFNQKKALYQDLTDVPTSYFEAINKINDWTFEFERMPMEVKNKFGNDAVKFVATIGTDEWYEKMGMNKKGNVVPDVKPEVKPEVVPEVKPEVVPESK